MDRVEASGSIGCRQCMIMGPGGGALIAPPRLARAIEAVEKVHITGNRELGERVPFQEARYTTVCCWGKTWKPTKDST
jgi:hypothetical protein